MGKLINIGSLCIDYVYALPEIVSQGVTLAATSREVFAGGKGLNQSIAAAKAGCQVHHIGAVGDDGQMLVDTLSESGVDTGLLTRQSGPSGHAMIQVNPAGQNAIVIAGGTNRSLSRSLLDQAIAAAQEGDWLLLQNETNEIAYAIEQGAHSAARVAINIAPADERIHSYPLHLVDVLVVNIAEACALAGEDDLQRAFTVLAARFPSTTLVLTEGADGLQVNDAGRHVRASAYSVSPVDETAAGDAFVGYLLARLVAGSDIEAALRLASAAGALATTRPGAAPSIPSLDEVQHLADNQDITLSVV